VENVRGAASGARVFTADGIAAGAAMAGAATAAGGGAAVGGAAAAGGAGGGGTAGGSGAALAATGAAGLATAAAGARRGSTWILGTGAAGGTTGSRSGGAFFGRGVFRRGGNSESSVSGGSDFALVRAAFERERGGRDDLLRPDAGTLACAFADATGEAGGANGGGASTVAGSAGRGALGAPARGWSWGTGASGDSDSGSSGSGPSSTRFLKIREKMLIPECHPSSALSLAALRPRRDGERESRDRPPLSRHPSRPHPRAA
jgi:hypothetical protein